ncbi:MAG: Ldh family oxidoreductase [Dehalococcoidia bacterium]
MTTPISPQTSEAGSAHRRYAARELIEFTTRVLVACGMPEPDARLGAEVLVDADLMGVDSHGIAHLPSHNGYAPGFRSGHVNPQPAVRTLRETPSTAQLDADRGFGPLVGYRAMRLAIEKAQAVGSGTVAVTNSRHFGAAGYYALMAVPEGCIGMAMTNAGPWVVPAGGQKKMIGTNPIAVAAPAGNEQPFSMDMATSTVAMGKLEIALREEKPIPDGWALDGAGQPTTDIPTVYREGGLTPLGSTLTTSSYKGYALGQMVDVFCGILSGIGHTMALPRGGAGHFFAAWQVEAFLSLEDFRATLDEMQRAFRDAAPASGHDRILLPGQREFETRREREANGIPLHAAVFTTLETLADEMNLSRPKPLG